MQPEPRRPETGAGSVRREAEESGTLFPLLFRLTGAQKPLSA